MSGLFGSRNGVGGSLSRRGEVWRRTAVAVALGVLVGGALLWVTRPGPGPEGPRPTVPTTQLVDPSVTTVPTIPVPEDPENPTNQMVTCIQDELSKHLDVKDLQQQGPNGADVTAALSEARQACADKLRR